MDPFVQEILKKIDINKEELATAKRILHNCRLNDYDRYIIEEYVREKEIAIRGHDKCVAYAMITNPQLFEV